MPITNPWLTGSTLGADQSANLPAFPFGEKPTSKPGREAKRLHDLARKATEHIREVRDHQSEIVRKLTEARAAFEQQAISGDLNPEREEELGRELFVAERRADQGLLAAQHRAAVAKQRDAVRALQVFLWDHFPDLLDAELRAEAEAASAELVKALESIRPVQERYRTIQNRVWELARITAAGEHAQYWAQRLQLATDPEPPLPSDEAIEEFERARQTAPELVAVEDD